MLAFVWSLSLAYKNAPKATQTTREPTASTHRNTHDTLITPCQRKPLSFSATKARKKFWLKHQLHQPQKKKPPKLLLFINIYIHLHTYNIYIFTNTYIMLILIYLYIHGYLFFQTLFQQTFYKLYLTLLRTPFSFHLIVNIVVIKLYSNCQRQLFFILHFGTTVKFC